MKTLPLPLRTCKKCGYAWIPRVETPKKCPSCQSKEWERKEK